MSTNLAPLNPVPRLTRIAMAIKPEGLIADTVCPRVPVEGEKFVYTRFTTDEYFTIPDTRIGRTSQPAQVEFGGQDVTDSTEDYGLDDPVPVKDIVGSVNTNAAFDPLEAAAENTAVLVELAREVRVANLLFSLNTYDPALRTTLSGTSQWSDLTSDPLRQILAARDQMLVQPNVMTFGQLGWTQFRQHPRVVAAVLNRASNSGSGGVTAAGWATKEAIASLLEIDEVLVGQSFVNGARKGQTAVYNRVWGKHAAMFRREKTMRNARSPLPTFCFTAQWGDRIAGTYSAPGRGIRGTEVVRVAEQVKELVSFQQCGYFFQNIVA